MDWGGRSWGEVEVEAVEASFDAAASHWEALGVSLLASFAVQRVLFLLATERASDASSLSYQAIQMAQSTEQQANGSESDKLSVAIFWHLAAIAESHLGDGIANADTLYQRGLSSLNTNTASDRASDNAFHGAPGNHSEARNYLLLAQARSLSLGRESQPILALTRLCDGLSLEDALKEVKASAQAGGTYAWLRWANLVALGSRSNGDGKALNVYREGAFKIPYEANEHQMASQRRIVLLHMVEYAVRTASSSTLKEVLATSLSWLPREDEVVEPCIGELSVEASKSRLPRFRLLQTSFVEHIVNLLASRPKDLASFLETVIGAAPHNPPLMLMAAAAKVRFGDVEGGRRILAEHTRKLPWGETGWVAAAYLEESDGNVEEAKSILNAGMVEEGMTAGARACLAKALGGAGNSLEQVAA